MPHPDFLAHHSTFFENLLEHRFLFDLRRELVLREIPQLLNVLKSDVDAFGFDLVLSVGDRSLHVQMKTRSGSPYAKPYDLSEGLWRLPNSCVIWMLYDAELLEPSSYYLLGFPMPDKELFPSAKRAARRKVKIQQATHKKRSLRELANVLFPPELASPNDELETMPEMAKNVRIAK
jgi:hypothetical protein